MAKADPILVDKTEVILTVSQGNSLETINVAYDKIIRLEFRKCEESKLFKKVPSEQILFTIRGREEPVVFFRGKVGEQVFDSVKPQLQKFAKDNRITFASNL